MAQKARSKATPTCFLGCRLFTSHQGQLLTLTVCDRIQQPFFSACVLSSVVGGLWLLKCHSCVSAGLLADAPWLDIMDSRKGVDRYEEALQFLRTHAAAPKTLVMRVVCSNATLASLGVQPPAFVKSSVNSGVGNGDESLTKHQPSVSQEPRITESNSAADQSPAEATTEQPSEAQIDDKEAAARAEAQAEAKARAAREPLVIKVSCVRAFDCLSLLPHTKRRLRGSLTGSRGLHTHCLQKADFLAASRRRKEGPAAGEALAIEAIHAAVMGTRLLLAGTDV